MLQNSKICAFTQFQANNGTEIQQNGQKWGQQQRMQETVLNPNKLTCQNRFQIENIMISQCQLIANYPESQQHTQTISAAQNFVDQPMGEQQSEPVCNNCIDIDSIMNPTYPDKFIAYSVNNFIEVNQKEATIIVPKEIDPPQYKERDETKNIPKNYIKAVFSFILQNPSLIRKMFSKKRNELESCEINKFLEYVRMERKNRTYTIGRLKQIWLNESYGKIMRIVYANFLRKRSLNYIYTSKIENKLSHTKYRYKLVDSLGNPSEFNSFK